MVNYVKRWLATPLGLALGAVAVVFAIVIAIGEILLALFDPGNAKDSIGRPELLFATFLAVGVLALFAVVAMLPEESTGKLAAPMVVGSKPFLAPAPPPPSVLLRNGPEGTIADIQPGYRLYAQNGALADVLGHVPGSYEFGRSFSGYLYSKGLYGASDQIWVPYEAVIGVYPQSRSVFLAIKGDETEHFGWTKPPASMARTPTRVEGPKGL